MSKAINDISPVTLSDRAYWSKAQKGFSVQAAGNLDIQVVFLTPSSPPDLTALLDDIGGRHYKMLSGGQRLALAQNVNEAIRNGSSEAGPEIHLLSRFEARYL